MPFHTHSFHKVLMHHYMLNEQCDCTTICCVQLFERTVNIKLYICLFGRQYCFPEKQAICILTIRSSVGEELANELKNLTESTSNN